jgi:hypothetical protein
MKGDVIMRFRKSMKLAPGVRMNFSGRGISWTLGPRGSSLGIGSRGTYWNTGIPGTGLYSRTKLLGGSSQHSSNRITSGSRNQYTYSSISISVSVDNDGNVLFKDANGNPLPEKLITAAKKQQGDRIHKLIEEKCDEINKEIESVGEIHIDTPNPVNKPKYTPEPYNISLPNNPVYKKYGCLGSFLQSERDKVDKENKELYERSLIEFNEWTKNKAIFDEAEKKRKYIIEEGIYKEMESMELMLEHTLENVTWPHETNISTELKNDGKVVYIDVDLPEIEDMPSKMAIVSKRGFKLLVNEMTQQQIQKLYMRHVHGVGFRLIGEVFCALPIAAGIVLSAYSQRPDKATGQIKDEYLYSVRVSRDIWNNINFNNLTEIDIVEAFSLFDIRREMSKTGVFKSIEPYE